MCYSDASEIAGWLLTSGLAAPNKGGAPAPPFFLCIQAMAKEQPEEIFVGPACMAVLGDRVRVVPDSLDGGRRMAGGRCD